MTKMAILEINPDIFRELLKLPKDAELIGIESSFYSRGTLRVKIIGAGWETREGAEIVATIGTITKFKNGKTKIDWGLPSNA